MTTVTQSISNFVITTDYNDLPDWCIHEAKRTLLNMLAISLSASEAHGAKILIEWAGHEEALEKSAIIGTCLLYTSPSPRD